MKTPPVTAALAVVELARQGRFTEIQQQFAPQLRPMVPAEALQAAWEGELAKHGPVALVGGPGDRAGRAGRGPGQGPGDASSTAH